MPTLAALLGVLALGVPWVSHQLALRQENALADRLEREALLVSDAIPWGDGAPLDAACARLAKDLDARVTVIAADGRVVGESVRSSETLENHADRPEVVEALATGSGRSARLSHTLGHTLMYVAVRQEREGRSRVVRVSVPLVAVEASVAAARALVVGGILASALIGLAAALVLSRRMLRRIHRLVAFAQGLAAGEEPRYLGPERNDELGVLEAQIGAMARSVAITIADLRVERERLEAILRGMVEGVLVADLDGIVVLLNDRARELLGVAPGEEGSGRRLVELARDPALAAMLRDLDRSAAVLSRDVALAGGSGPQLQVNGARLTGPDGRPFGFVLVLHDVTELRRLEVVRRDFVANVSHELRTPLTAIKGFAETLLGPAGDDRATAKRFLAVIDRHSERLGRLIDDLLTLSDLELGRMPLRLGAVSVASAVDDVLQIFAERAARAGVVLTADVAPGTPAVHADGDRLRQVLINLVDNGLKYTQGNGRVVVRAGPAGPPHAGMVEMVVDDTGCGIPAQDLPRLTERFFRVDKARSRELGGTGLGLAIVKHIVQAHGGLLAITSTLGQGTAVRVLLPTATARAGVDPARAAAPVSGL